MSREEIRNKFDENRSKSEDDFEKNLTYISAGALGLSLTFIEKIITIDSSSHKWFLILGWILLGLTLSINLISHLISSYYNRISQEDFDKKAKNLGEIIDRRNLKLSIINWSTVVLLISGVFSIIIFTSINITTMAKQKQQSQQTKESPKEKLGRTIPKPSDTTTIKPKTENNNGKKN